MKIFLFIIGILLLLLLLVLVTKIHIFISYYHNGDEDELKVKVTAWKFIKYTIKVPLIKIDEDSPSNIVKEKKKASANIVKDEKKMKITLNTILEKINKIKDFLEHIVGFYKILKRLLKRIDITKFEWKTNIGTSDAALTGVLTGVLWSIKGIVLGIASHYMNLSTKPHIEIVPNFQSAISKTRFQCMISFRLGQAIFAGLLVVRYWKRKPKQLKPIGENMKG